MSDGRNRLGDEQSPYLRQHADNPVHWHPWDEEALAEARERDVPIFLSVGYAACHWCHVMADESFEDEGVADLLNENFVPIKVDREERPDVDSIYQTICQGVTGRGGWPLSAWLTPEGKPFFVGTYFPKEARGNHPGFRDLLEDIANSWTEDREEIENRATQWTRAIEGELEATPSEPGDAPGSELLETGAETALRSADREHGGFGSGTKFPQSTRVHLLLRAFERTGRDQFRDVAVEALDAMADGGMYDHVGGGFHRYATDRAWRVPHFEKMLYDNAELPRLFLAGYQVTGDERYAQVAAETFEFVARELTHPDGGFYSTLDAQSEGEEGTFYVWTPAAVREAVEDELAADLLLDRFGVTESGNFEGQTVLAIRESVDDLAAEYDLPRSEVRELLDVALEQLFEARRDRIRPARDEKVLAGWNGLMVSALAEGALVLDDSYAAQAEHALSFVREHLWDGERLSRRYKDSDAPRASGRSGAGTSDSDTQGESEGTDAATPDVAIDGYLEDYAFLARGAFDLYQVTGDVDHLAFALDLARAIEREFWDPREETLYFTPASGESLVARPQERRDQSTPSSMGVALDVLQSLSHFAPDEAFAAVPERVLETHARTIEANPIEHVSLVLAGDHRAAGSLELTVVADALPGAWRERVGATYLPNRVLALRPPDEETLAEWVAALDVDGTPPIWADRAQTDGEATLYVCRSFTCSPPLADVDEALEWVTDLAPQSS